MTTERQPCPYCGRTSGAEPLRPPAVFCVPCLLRRCFPYLTRLHRKTLLWFYGVGALLTFLLMLPGAISGHGEPLGTGVLAAALAITGPFTGTLARGHWNCSACHGFTMASLPYLGTALAGAWLVQLTPLPPGKWTRWCRMAAWVLGWLAWFAGTLVSVLLANS